MEAMRVFLVAIGTLLAAISPAWGTVVETHTINTSFVAEQATGEPNVGSSPSFVCVIKETPFFRNGNDISFYKRQGSDAAWVKITSRGSPSPRYSVSLLNQETATEVAHRLTIENFQAADVGVYRCSVTPVIPKDTLGTTSAEVSLSIAPRSATVNVTASVEASQPGIYWYEAHPTSTTCTVDVISSPTTSVSLTDVEVKVMYKDNDHTRDFLATPTFSWDGSLDAMREPRRRITLVSQTFKPVSRTPLPVECVAVDQHGNELGRGSIVTALKSLPRIECIQSNEPPAYLDDLDVMITCEVHDYDWNPKSSHISWSFTSNDGGDLTTVTLDDPTVGKAGRRIVEDQESRKHSLLIHKITSDAARFTVYNIALKENEDTVTTRTFTLEVLNRSRSSEFEPNTARPVTADVLVLSLSLVAVLAV